MRSVWRPAPLGALALASALDGKRSVETLKIRNEDADVSVIDLRPQR